MIWRSILKKSEIRELSLRCRNHGSFRIHQPVSKSPPWLPVRPYQGFHSAGSGATMPSLASHRSSGSQSGSMPISLAYSWISDREEKEEAKAEWKEGNKQTKMKFGN